MICMYCSILKQSKTKLIFAFELSKQEMIWLQCGLNASSILIVVNLFFLARCDEYFPIPTSSMSAHRSSPLQSDAFNNTVLNICIFIKYLVLPSLNLINKHATSNLSQPKIFQQENISTRKHLYRNSINTVFRSLERSQGRLHVDFIATKIVVIAEQSS